MEDIEEDKILGATNEVATSLTSKNMYVSNVYTPNE